MSSQITYDPVNIVVPNVVIAYQPFVDVPSGAPNTLVNADISSVVNIVPQKYWVAVPQNNQVVEMNDAQKTRVNLFSFDARVKKFGINQFTFQGIVGNLPQTILTGLKKGAQVRGFCEVPIAGSVIFGSTLNITPLQIKIFTSGLLSIRSLDNAFHEVYLDIIYS